jgi:hypothetical protein
MSPFIGENENILVLCVGILIMLCVHEIAHVQVVVLPSDVVLAQYFEYIRNTFRSKSQINCESIATRSQPRLNPNLNPNLQAFSSSSQMRIYDAPAAFAPRLIIHHDARQCYLYTNLMSSCRCSRTTALCRTSSTHLVRDTNNSSGFCFDNRQSDANHAEAGVSGLSR